jgi:uncharacterized protein
VRKLLQKASRSRDELPYTPEFDRLKARFERWAGRGVSQSHFWRTLTKVGKRGGLARSSPHRRAQRAPTISTEDQLELMRLLPDGVGNRDQFPYTEAFDEIHRQFTKLTKVKLDKHEFWRVLARVGKKSRKPQPVFDVAPLGGLPKQLVEFLEFQNPWWSGKASKPTERFRRWAFPEVMHRLESNATPIAAIRGPRQVGKTTIQEQLIEEFLHLRRVHPSRILRVQFDEVPSLGSLSDPILAISRWFEKNVAKGSLNALARRGEPAYLFFDEVQNLKSWAPQMKAIVDHADVRTLVTGSSALRIASGQDSLAGRISMIEMGPLRLHEIAGIRRLGNLPAFEPAAGVDAWATRDFWLDLLKHARRHRHVLKQAFSHFSDLGGYPVCHKAAGDRTDLLKSIVRNVVERTLTHDLKAGTKGKRRDPSILEESFKLVCRYAGQSVRHERMRNEVGQILNQNVRERTLSDAIRFLANSLLIHEIPPMEALLRRQSNPRKLCLCDHFVREGWLQERVPISPWELRDVQEAVSTVAGRVIESCIGYYLKGVPGVEVSWFPERSDEPELDFVLTIGLRRIPIEVKYCRRQIEEKILKGIRSFCSQVKYNAEFGLVITQDQSGKLGDSVIAIPAYAFLAVK